MNSLKRVKHMMQALGASVVWLSALAGPLSLRAAQATPQDTASPTPTFAAGGLHTCALAGGAVYCWGYNSYSQLGDETAMHRTLPVAVTNMIGGGATAVAAGGHYSCAIKNGALYCWGRNDEGQLGDGTMITRTTPVAVQNMNSNIAAVAGGGFHACAIKGGALYCWGRNVEGQLGDGTTITRTTSVAVQNMGSGVTAVAAGFLHTCAIKGGALYCWGANSYGQLGNGTGTPSTTPVAVQGMGGGVTAVSGGWYHTCAIKGGALYCWGFNNYGQLGDGTTTSRYTPVAVQDMGSNVTAFAAGGFHSMGMKQDECLFAWGHNLHGQHGDGTTTNARATPVQVSGGCNWGTTVAPFASFGKAAPISGTTDLPTTVTLSWSAPVTGTVNHYRYCVATTTRCTPTTQVLSTTTNVTVSGLTLGVTYRWQVRACVDSACNPGDLADADGGAHWSFKTQSAIGSVNTSGPTGTRKEVAPMVVRMGELVTYTIVISNARSTAVTTQVTDTLAVSMTLVSATAGHAQSGQRLVWSSVLVPASGTTVLTITARVASGPLAGGYTLGNSVTIGAVDGEIARSAPTVTVGPRQAFVPMMQRP